MSDEAIAAPKAEPVYSTVHMCIDISGVLRRSDNELRALFTEEGSQRSGAYVRNWLKLQLAQGKRVLPMGAACEGFSYQTGCPGHRDPASSVWAKERLTGGAA